ncbi:pilus assembly protein [Nocardioides seonyuensis]|uniref:Pilus assembly protein n=1 Tax=Nocardioides seonyuensis TaxID=2518371 RepID=A0A4V1BM45_9ACTN|nr:TadE family type IV pilus minor pilin [Nocardioides seonyuensis]QBX55092.1 pilus assembly protein [Nocardioides seonyuensis]
MRAAPAAGRGAGERGAVTAELALGLPLLLAVALGMVWLLAAGAAQVQVIDASREAARAIARGDDQVAAVVVAQRVAPEGTDVEVSLEGGRVVVTASAKVKGPGGLFSHLPEVRVSADAVALVEE